LFAPGAEALLRSAARFHPDIQRFCYVPQEELEELRARLGSLARVEACPEVIRGIPAKNMVNVGRLFVTVPVVDVAAYIDADALICAPCERLWEVAPGRVNAAADSAICVANNLSDANRHFFVEKYPQVALHKGVNAGVFALRRKDWPDLAVSFERIMVEGRYRYDTILDQPILNVVFAGRIDFLPFEYNAHGLWDNRMPKDVKIIHYTGRCKPWMDGFPRHEPSYWHWLKYGQLDVREGLLACIKLWIIANWPRRAASRYLRQK
jgi:lipopolysaccharide biosynthesis glycosyltransferase